MPLTIRPATEADLPAILDIYNYAVLHTTATADYEPHTLEMRQAWYAERRTGGYPVLVAEEAGRVVGWGSLSPYKPRVGYRFTVENSLYVAPDCRGRGIGKALLAELIVQARERGYHAILAGIDGANEVSLRLHAQFGFEKVGHLPQVITKFDRWLDLIDV